MSRGISKQDARTALEEFFEDVKKELEKQPNVVVAVSEGLQFADGTYVGEGTQSGAVDVFGHKYLSGTGKALDNIKELLASNRQKTSVM